MKHLLDGDGETIAGTKSTDHPVEALQDTEAKTEQPPNPENNEQCLIDDIVLQDTEIAVGVHCPARRSLFKVTRDLGRKEVTSGVLENDVLQPDGIKWR